MDRRSKKRRVAAVLGVLMAMAAATVAFAYFTGATNSAQGSGTVGTSTQWGIATSTPSWSGSLTALYPGASNDTEYVPFTITNNGHGNQGLQSVTVAVAAESNGDAETAGSSPTDITGCKASWFTAQLDGTNPAVPDDIAAGGTYNGRVDLTMQDVNQIQDACQGASPAVTITAS